jgi:hypothetical protein
MMMPFRSRGLLREPPALRGGTRVSLHRLTQHALTVTGSACAVRGSYAMSQHALTQQGRAPYARPAAMRGLLGSTSPAMQRVVAGFVLLCALAAPPGREHSA